MPPTGVEPVSSDFQSAVVTASTTVAIYWLPSALSDLTTSYDCRVQDRTAGTYLMVDRVGIEPTDNCLQSSQEPQLNHSPYYTYAVV